MVEQTGTSNPTIDQLVPIPQPHGVPVLGNLLNIVGDTPVQAMMELAREQHEGIFELHMPGRNMVVVFGPSLVDEICDDARFDKLPQLRNGGRTSVGGDGLFTAWTYEPNWRKAHNILLPNFSQAAMKNYMPMMVDIGEQLAEKWERQNPGEAVDVPADMTRLTMDTIGLCGFGYRFNSFYREEPHPFVTAMTRGLNEGREQQTRLPGQTKLMVRKRRQFQEDTTTMYSLVDTLIRERKAHPEDVETKDLLSYMLEGVDKETGEGLDDVNIRYQIVTFLVAGHETTSGLLSFAIYYLLHNPSALERVYHEVDAVLGDDLSRLPSYEQVRKLEYVLQILKETLRLWPTAPAFSRYPLETTVIGGKYQLQKGQELLVLTPMLHRDLGIWGPSPEAFDPDHFTRQAEQARPAYAYKPFGHGQRSCIGRQFALQEATLVLGMLLQRFEFVDYSGYQLKIKETMTVKPEDFHIQVRPRTHRNGSGAGHTPAGAPAGTAVLERPVSAETEAEAEESEPESPPVRVQHAAPMLVLFGSNLGATEDLARQVANDANARGFNTTVAPLDEYVNRLPTEGVVVIATASYNGNPPDNAARFVDWVSNTSLPPDALQGVKYTVFGCGSREWASTYQKVPTTIDQALAAHGAERVYTHGEGDVSDDFDDQFRTWSGPLWPALATAVGVAIESAEGVDAGHRYEVEVVAEPAVASPFRAEYGARVFTIHTNRELHRKDGPNPSPRSTRHIDVALADGVAYLPGDYLGVLPRNSDDLVRRVAARFKLEPSARLRIVSNSTSKSFLPVDQPIEVATLLRGYLDVQDVATRSQIQVLAEYAECPPERQRLLALAGDDADSAALYRREILDRHISVLDLLEENQSCSLPFNIYLEFLPPLKPRYYSISSSPMVDPHQCSVTVGVLDAPARSGHGRYQGVCSTYLALQGEGATIEGFIKNPSTQFRLPADPTTPIIMVGTGTGLAPYRGFLEERAELQKNGQSLGPALLFFGCRNPEQDYLYENELRDFEQTGIGSVVCAFSRQDNQPRMYVQDAIKAHADDVWSLLESGAVIYVCGDASRMAPDVRRAFASLYQDKQGVDQAAADAWVSELVNQQRYAADVWPSN